MYVCMHACRETEAQRHKYTDTERDMYVYLSIYLSIYRSIYLSIYIYIYIYMPACSLAGAKIMSLILGYDFDVLHGFRGGERECACLSSKSIPWNSVWWHSCFVGLSSTAYLRTVSSGILVLLECLHATCLRKYLLASLCSWHVC